MASSSSNTTSVPPKPPTTTPPASRWGYVFQLFPTALMAPLTNAYMRTYYYPCSARLEQFATKCCPRRLSPNVFTVVGTVTCVPGLWAIRHGRPWLAASSLMMHELIDFVDGCVARSFAKQGIPHNGDFGAFFDSMCDKIFGWSVLLGILALQPMNPIWTGLAIIKSLVHLALTIKRIQDYFFPSRKDVKLKAGSYGKFGVTCEDLAMALAPFAPHSVACNWLSTFCLAMSVDLGLRSLGDKLFLT